MILGIDSYIKKLDYLTRGFYGASDKLYYLCCFFDDLRLEPPKKAVVNVYKYIDIIFEGITFSDGLSAKLVNELYNRAILNVDGAAAIYKNWNEFYDDKPNIGRMSKELFKKFMKDTDNDSIILKNAKKVVESIDKNDILQIEKQITESCFILGITEKPNEDIIADHSTMMKLEAEQGDKFLIEEWKSALANGIKGKEFYYEN